MPGRSVTVVIAVTPEAWPTTGKEPGGPSVPVPTRICRSAPGSVVWIRTLPTVVGRPRSKIRPTPGFRLPNSALRLYSNVDHVVSGLPSAALPTWAGFSAPSPGGGSYSVTEATGSGTRATRSEEHTSELQSRPHLVCRLLLEK